MEEFEEEELYDCEIYTNEVINSEEEPELEENDEIILLCPHCGFVYKMSDPPRDYRGRKIDINNYLLRSQEGYFRCPLCSKIVPYQFISEEEYEIIVKANKKKEEERQKKLQKKEEKKNDAFVKINVSKFNKELTDIQEDLIAELNANNISIDKFSYMYKSLAIKLYDKYRPIFEKCGRKKEFDRYDLMDTLNAVNNDVVQNYKSNSKEEEKFNQREEILNDEIIQNERVYQEEYSKIFEKSKVYSQDIEVEDFIEKEKSDEKRLMFDKLQAKLDIEHEKQVRRDEEKSKILSKLKTQMERAKEVREQNLEDKSSLKVDKYTKSIENKN